MRKQRIAPGSDQPSASPQTGQRIYITTCNAIVNGLEVPPAAVLVGAPIPLEYAVIHHGDPIVDDGWRRGPRHRRP